MGTPPYCSAIFSKGDNFHDFLFAYPEDEVFPKWGLLLKEVMTPLYKGDNNENDRVAFPESVLSHLKIIADRKDVICMHIRTPFDQ